MPLESNRSFGQNINNLNNVEIIITIITIYEKSKEPNWINCGWLRNIEWEKNVNKTNQKPQQYS